MNKVEAVEFAIASAESAYDDWAPYGSVENAVGSHRDNVIDTLNDEKAAEFIHDALCEFDLKAKELAKKQ